MASTKKIKLPEKTFKQNKKPEPRKSMQQTLSPTVSSVTSPIRIIKTMKSQSNNFYPTKIAEKKTEPSAKNPSNTISIKSVEKKVDLLRSNEEPSPIAFRNKKGFFSMTEEEYKELNIFLREMSK